MNVRNYYEIVYVYVLKNNVNGKQYVGLTNDVDQRFLDHCKSNNESKIACAIHKYGRENFSMSIVGEFKTYELAEEREIELIAELKTFGSGSWGYNMTRGGDGCRGHKHTDDWKQNKSDECKRRVANGTHPFAGEQGSQLQKRIIAEGNHPLTDGEMQRQTQNRMLKDGTHNFVKFRKSSDEIARIVSNSWKNATPEARALRCQRISKKRLIFWVKKRYAEGKSRPEDAAILSDLREKRIIT